MIRLLRRSDLTGRLPSDEPKTKNQERRPNTPSSSFVLGPSSFVRDALEPVCLSSSSFTAAVHGCTFDDFIFAPQYSTVETRDHSSVDLTSRLSARISLKRPLVSANMDTITRAAMAILQAEEGGIGIIDRGFKAGDIEPQVREVEVVKRTQHGVIVDPYRVAVSASLNEAVALMERSRVGTLIGAEGLEISVPARGSARPILLDMLKHLYSSVSYGGARSLIELKRLFWENPERYLIKLSPAARRESFER